MKPSNSDIGIVLEKALEHHSQSISFESTWNMHLNNNRKTIKPKKQTAIILVAVLIFFAIGSVAFAGIMRNIDKTDYPFVNDPRVIGKWESVDFVEKVDDFVPGIISWKEKLYLSSLAFTKQGKILSSIENGNLAISAVNWTKDKVLNIQEKTASEYVIKKVNGSTYMYLEWKSGDYIFRNMKPYYYVLKKVDSNDYSNYQVAHKTEDKIDYPFIDDTQMKGKWESVDFVKTIASFKPEVSSWMGDLYLTGLAVEENGKLTVTTTKGESSSSLIWTKGMIISRGNKTASKCEVKEINGTAYMFYEWKSGDYTNRGMTPEYYVLKKIE
ncbi:MAG: hypothetical protein APF81_13115 [Desulfosporosinus sp. BRH_c37]|nr:MAG: hypothetical protein APF81_13115 [Desulfosporosinus sp. BRH_c37]